MSALRASSDCGFVSPLASQLAQFLALKHAMGYRYREEGRALRDLDRFLNTRLSADDPLVTSAQLCTSTSPEEAPNRRRHARIA